LGGWDWEDHSSRPAQANSWQDPISKITRGKWTGGVAQPLTLNPVPPTKKKKKKLTLMNPSV
jgi:hypothetical protein